jgi:hypothetical protein
MRRGFPSALSSLINSRNAKTGGRDGADRWDSRKRKTPKSLQGCSKFVARPQRFPPVGLFETIQPSSMFSANAWVCLGRCGSATHDFPVTASRRIAPPIIAVPMSGCGSAGNLAYILRFTKTLESDTAPKSNL